MTEFSGPHLLFPSREKKRYPVYQNYHAVLWLIYSAMVHLDPAREAEKPNRLSIGGYDRIISKGRTTPNY